jgi:hypothetical protein
MRATRSMAACNRSFVNGCVSPIWSTTPLRSAKTPLVPLIIRSEIDGSSRSSRNSSGKNGRIRSKLIAWLPLLRLDCAHRQRRGFRGTR